MERLRFTLDIGAPPARVWSVLWDDASYRDWTSVFSEGSHAVSDWHEGSPIRFVGPEGSGMLAVIERKVANERMVFRHVTEIRGGQEQPPAAWAGALESYTLTPRDGGTDLVVEVDTAEEHAASFRDLFPKALARVKALAEATLYPPASEKPRPVG